jgi:UrcA family protein
MGKLLIVLGALAAALAITGLSFLVAPVAAYGQPPATVVVVTAPGAPQSALSYRVTFNDLDLKKELGKTELKRRMRISAKYVCSHRAATAAKPVTYTDCRRRALDVAEPQARLAIAAAEARPGAFHPGPAWQPPPGAD